MFQVPLGAVGAEAAFSFPASVAAGASPPGVAVLDVVPGDVSPAEVVSMLLKNLP